MVIRYWNDSLAVGTNASNLGYLASTSLLQNMHNCNMRPAECWLKISTESWVSTSPVRNKEMHTSYLNLFILSVYNQPPLWAVAKWPNLAAVYLPV